jgi:hypothetical protein
MSDINKGKLCIRGPYTISLPSLYNSLQFLTVPYSFLTNALVDSPITMTHVAELDFLAGELAIKHQGVRRQSFRNTKHLEGDLE